MKISKKFREHFAVDVVEREIKSFFFIKIKREEEKKISQHISSFWWWASLFTTCYITKHTAALSRERSIINIIRNIWREHLFRYIGYIWAFLQSNVRQRDREPVQLQLLKSSVMLITFLLEETMTRIQFNHMNFTNRNV